MPTTENAETRLEVFDAVGAETQADAVAEVWRDAFGPIDDLAAWRQDTFDRHREREQFRLVLATDADGPVGFAWGYLGRRGQFWPDRVLDRLGAAAGPWVGGHVEFVELAVSSRGRRRGIGGRLHDTLIEALPSRPALLGTSSDPDDPAVRLYRSRGWAHLGLLDDDAQVMLRPARPTTEYVSTDQFRGARLHLCELDGLELRDCEVTGLKIVDCYGSDVSLGGDFERLTVNDVEVGGYVEAELDRRHPARALARNAESADDFRSAWRVVEQQWVETLEQTRALPTDVQQARVADEWSLVETQRHLLFASDAWFGNAVLEEDAPYHPWGFPAGGMPAAESAKLGLTIDDRPSLAEVLEPRLRRMATVRAFVETLTDAELDRRCGRKPADPYPDAEYVVRRCLRVVLKEEAEHHRYAVRDLAVLAAG